MGGDRRLEIAPRFEGPPGAGNGGYVAGQLAAALDADQAACRLRRPVPTARSLSIRAEPEGGLGLYDEDRLLASVRRVELDFACPPSPGFDAAAAVAGRCRAFETHPFPGCFVCGPSAAEGLAILPGPLPDAPLPGAVAAPWVPGADLCPDGWVGAEFVWAALDCPSVFPLLEAPETRALEPMVLGQLVAAVHGRPQAGERCVLLAWGSPPEGRRATGWTALYGESGALLGQAEATWISLAEPAV